jgi:glycosyltransferase involved in cell wall biosynthesis
MPDITKPRILMIAPVFYPYPPIWPEGIVNANLAMAMKRAGWHIDVIVAGYQGGTDRYPSDAVQKRELADNVHIVKIGRQVKTHAPKRLMNLIRGLLLTGRLLRQLDWGLSVLEIAEKLNRHVHYDVILSRAIPDYAHFAALLVHQRTRIPWIANWNDPVPNHKFPPPYGQGPDSPLTPNRQKWYNSICDHCTWHTFPSHRLRSYMCSYLPGNILSKSSVVHHVAIGKHDFGIQSSDSFSMCYAGSVLPPRDVNVFFEGIKRFKQTLNNEASFFVRFLVDKPELVSNCAKSKGIEELIVIEPAVPYSQMPELLAQSHVLVIIEAPLEEGIFMASKIVDYVQIGRPILSLSPKIGTNADLLEKYGGGIAVDCQSPDSVVQALRTLFNHWKSGTLNQAYGSDRLFDHFSVQTVLKQYQALLHTVQSKPMDA